MTRPSPRLPTRRTPSDSQVADSPCSLLSGGLTDEEVDVLRRMRAIHDTAREVRARLGGAQGEEAEALAVRLAALRSEWRRLAEAREAARHRRMVFLGHESPECEGG
jgi:hypothetical protein